MFIGRIYIYAANDRLETAESCTDSHVISHDVTTAVPLHVFGLVEEKPFDNKPSHSMCCHLAIGAGTKIIPI